MAQIYEKWREPSVDLLEIPFQKIKIEEIISYPPAQNDVFECVCIYDRKRINVIIKYERSKMADFVSEIKTLEFLKEIGLKCVPKIIEYGTYNAKKYIILEKVEGERLSDINKLGITASEKKAYLYKYGVSLANIHNIKNAEKRIAKQRIINEYPKEENYPEIPLAICKYIKYLKANDIRKELTTFIHGDFHYANVLWNNKEINGILDWEYSGYGFKEQDIAWALILRPMQEFLDNKEDIKSFLEGYKTVGKYNKDSLKWCLINGMCHFYLLNKTNENYLKKLDVLLEIIANNFEF